MEPEYSKDEWQEHLWESWIIVAIVALIVLLVVWQPFHHEPSIEDYPELQGAYRNLQIQEILERRQQEGAGRLFPPRGFGGLSPHQVTGTGADTSSGTITTAPAEGGETGETAPAATE
ncbi:hypothetical protein [Pseudooceanicola sp. LIPI14-2-Ac024]|uniref:hypothetical protein n=1 Tax=Pseudooceanicola sp. LIPI14-2-Ac024 TaxID=3344875 RepID=UPI0035D0520D